MSRMTIKASSAPNRNNKKGGIPKKASMIVYAVTLVLAVIARVNQLVGNLDYSTGRYLDPSPMKNYTAMIIYGGIILMAVILLAGTARDKVIGSCIMLNPMRLRYDRVNKKISPAAAYSAMLMALLIVVEIIYDISMLVSGNKYLRESMPPEEAELYSVFTGYDAWMGVRHVLMFFTALTFVSIGVNIFAKNGLSHPNCAALSFYAVWKLVEILQLFINNPVMGVNTHMVYVILSGMASTIFFLMAGRFFNGNEKKFTRFWMCMFGYTASILAAVSVIPRYVLFFLPMSNDDRLAMNVPAISDIGSVFMTITMVAVFWSTYVYRVMPKLNVNGKRKWSGLSKLSKTYQPMASITEKTEKDYTNS